MPFSAAWMNLEINILSEEDRKRKTIFCDITHVWNLKGTYQWNRNRLTDIENRLVVAKEGRTGSFGLTDEIYLYIEWIKNEVLQYSTGNFIQHLGINLIGKEYICRAESIFCTAEMNYPWIIFLIFKNLWFLYLQWNITWQKMHKLKGQIMQINSETWYLVNKRKF